MRSPARRPATEITPTKTTRPGTSFGRPSHVHQLATSRLARSVRIWLAIASALGVTWN